MVSAINPAIAIADSLSLQNDIDSAFRWASTWLMQLNPTNYKVMHLGKRNPNLNYSVPNQENTTRLPLESTSHERDLGVIISSSLKPSLQCRKAAATMVDLKKLSTSETCQSGNYYILRIYSTRAL